MKKDNLYHISLTYDGKTIEYKDDDIEEIIADIYFRTIFNTAYESTDYDIIDAIDESKAEMKFELMFKNSFYKDRLSSKENARKYLKRKNKVSPEDAIACYDDKKYYDY